MIKEYKDNYIDRSIAVAAVRRRYKGIKKKLSLLKKCA